MVIIYFYYLTLACSHKSTPYFRTKFWVSKTWPMAEDLR